MKNWHVLFAVVAIGMFLASPRIANMTSQPEPQQQLRYGVRYTCNGDTIIVGHCRHDDDTRAFPPTKPEDDFCMVYYPDRPLQNGLRVQKTELLGDIIKRLQACGGFDQPSATRQPAASSTSAPGSAKSFSALGDKYLHAMDYAKALEAYKKAVSLDPSLENALWGLVVSAGAEGEGQTRMAALQRLNVLKPHNYDILFEIGVFGVQDKMYKEALAALLEARRIKPNSIDPNNHLGLAYAGLNQNTEAIAAFKEAIRIDPTKGRPHANLGNLYVNLNRNAEAVPELTLAIRLEPTYALSYQGLGMAYARLGKKAEAIEIYRQLQGIDKARAQALYDEINKPVSQQRANAVGETTGRSTPASPTSVKTASTSGTPHSLPELVAQADRLYDDKKYAEAIEVYKKAVVLKLDTATLARTHFRMGYAYFKLNQYEDSILHLREALRLNPEDPNTNFGLGYIYYNHKEYPQALTAFQKAIRLNPNNAEAQYWVGETYLVGLEQGDKAIPFFRESLRLRPKDARTLGELGAAYYFDRDDSDAIDAFKEAIRLKPRDPALYYGLGLAYLSNEQKDDAMRVYHTLETLDAKKAKELYDMINK